MEIKMKGISVLHLEHNGDSKMPELNSTSFKLELDDIFNKSQYFDEDDNLTIHGVKATTQCFVQGLVANIHYSNQRGLLNDAEHLRDIISSLERGFIQIAEISKSKENN